MKKLTILIGALAALAAPAIAAADPIAARQALMRNNAGASALAGAVANGDLEYHPVVGRAAIAALSATAANLGDLFPEGSGEGTTRAAPQIWEDWEGFTAMLGGFQEAVADAREAAGPDGLPDAEAFAEAIQPALGYCGACHTAYRTQ